MQALQVIHLARSINKCIPAFNIPHIPMVKPIIQAIIDENSIGMIQVARVEWEKMSSESLERVAEEYQKYRNNLHTLLHLDHIPAIDEDYKSVDYASYLKRAINSGYQSVMIDGSRMGLEENIKVTADAAAIAHEAGIACEAELGAVLGHESKTLPPYEEIFASKMGFTKVDEAAKFAKESGCDWLSVATGNIHGAIAEAVRNQKKPEAKLDISHISALHHITNLPLVLHGGSGIKHQFITGAIAAGIAKINVGTEIRQTYEFALLERPLDIAYAQDQVYSACRKYISDYLMNTDLRNEIVPS